MADELAYLIGGEAVRLPKLIKDSYAEPVFDSYDMNEVIEYAQLVNF